MGKLSAESAGILRWLSPNSEEGKCFLVPKEHDFRKGTHEPSDLTIHVRNFEAGFERTPMIGIRFSAIDSLGIVDIVSLSISTGRNFANCALTEFTQRWVSEEQCGDFKIRIGTTTDETHTQVSQYVETSEMIGYLENLLQNLNKSQNREMDR